VLVGFMGAGKSAVGRRLADLLGWQFRDMDREVEEIAGLSVPEIFRTLGEDRFRELEAGAARRLLGRERHVIAAGGGWACREGRLESLDPETLSIWLRVSAETAVARLEASPVRRPLLEVERPLDRARGLLEAREVFYRKAAWAVDTESRSADQVAREIAARLGSGGGLDRTLDRSTEG
jgi:shikimate kinase